MPRGPRVAIAGATYHVTARGNDGAAIFRDDHDRIHLIGLLSRTVVARRWMCFAYCLMENHYHLLVRTPEPDLSLGMRYIQTRYARRFNSRHGRSGHLFGDRFHDCRVDGEEHLVNAATYVALNPVRAGIVAHPADWRWSSCRATLRGDDDPLVHTAALLELLSPDMRCARELYRELVGHGAGLRRVGGGDSHLRYSW